MRFISITRRKASRLLALAVVVGCTTISGEAATIDLGGAQNYVVLGATTVTNTGPTQMVGDVGVSPGTAMTGMTEASQTGGSMHFNDLSAATAKVDATAAYATLAALPLAQNLTGQDLGGLTLTPGVYRFASSAQLTGKLTLDGQGQTDPLFVFQIGSTLTTASGASIVEINGADACDAYFQVGSSATLGTGTSFDGTILALTSDTLTTGTSVDGHVFALNGAVTMDDNFVTVCHDASVPEPGSLALLGGSLGAAVLRRRRRISRG